MAIYKPSELRQFLESLGVGPKKVLSQNFLIDGNIIKKIVEAAQVHPDEVILEIGPGPGALTEALLATGATVIAVEKDNALATALERFQNGAGHLHIFAEDILAFPFEERLAPFLEKGKKVKVIANLPYHLSTPILAALVTKSDLFSNLVVMVQEEMARRFVGEIGTKDYSSFTVFLNFFSDPHYAFRVSRNSFFPVPKVESAVVNLILKKPPEVSDQEAFFKMVRTAFGQRRKMLRSSLRGLFAPDKLEEALNKLNLAPTLRPENIPLQKWLQLFELLA